MNSRQAGIKKKRRDFAAALYQNVGGTLEFFYGEFAVGGGF